MLAAVSQAADVVLGRLSELSWTGTGVDKTAAWGSTDVLDGLIGRWTFDDTATDSVGTNNGVWTGTAAYSTGKIGKAASLDGSSYITLTPDGRSDFAVQEYTVSAWVRSSLGATYLPVWSYDYTSHSSPYYAQNITIYSDGRIDHSWNDGSYLGYIEAAVGTFAADAWTHLLITFKSGEQKIYMNGELKISGTTSVTVSYYNQPVWIGRANFATAPACLIDDVRFYNRALSGSEVANIYNHSK